MTVKRHWSESARKVAVDGRLKGYVAWDGECYTVIWAYASEVHRPSGYFQTEEDAVRYAWACDS